MVIGDTLVASSAVVVTSVTHFEKNGDGSWENVRTYYL